MKFLGQHFLKNRGVIEKIIGAIDPKTEDVIVEIGPGHGELTAALRNAMRIIAIEKDHTLIEPLHQRASNEQWKNVEIVEGDALKILPSIINNIGNKASCIKIVGNIPYYITGHLLRVIGELEIKPARCVFMVQKEVAERIAAAPPKMNRLAASVQFWAKPEIVARIPRGDFSPPPEVDSAVIELGANHPGTNEKVHAKRYYAAVHALFAQPRKTILNNLAAKGGQKQDLAKSLATLGLDPESRPQNLTVEDIHAIANLTFWDEAAGTAQ